MSDLDTTSAGELLVDIPRAGEILGGVGRDVVYDLIRAGEVQSVHIGRRRLVLVSSLREYVDRLTATAL